MGIFRKNDFKSCKAIPGKTVKTRQNITDELPMDVAGMNQRMADGALDDVSSRFSGYKKAVFAGEKQREAAKRIKKRIEFCRSNKTV